MKRKTPSDIPKAIQDVKDAIIAVDAAMSCVYRVFVTEGSMTKAQMFALSRFLPLSYDTREELKRRLKWLEKQTI